MRLVPFFLLSACASPAVSPLPFAAPTALSTDGTDLSDGHGTVVLRGVNARVEGLFDVSFDDGRTPLEPIPPFSGEDCAQLGRELGWNLLRLPVNWSAIEPIRGSFDDDYIERVGNLVADCAAQGVWTLVDLHQDAWSKEIGEDGAPLWAIVPPPETLLEGPLEDLGERRTSLQVLRAFSSFFDNVEDLQGAYAAMAVHLAGALVGTPGLLGIELMNEPVAWDDEKLDRFHQRVGSAVAEALPDGLVVFEPDSLRNRRDVDPLEHPTDLPRAVYAPHHYTGVFTSPPGAVPDVAAIRESALQMRQEGEAHGAPTIVGEFGHDPRTEQGRMWLRAALDAHDEARLSTAFWVWEEWSQGGWGLWDRGGTAEAPVRGIFRDDAALLLARPFPRSVPGRLQSLSWDGESERLNLEIEGADPDWPWVLLSVPERLGALSSWEARCDGEIRPLTAAGPGAALLECAGAAVTLTLDPDRGLARSSAGGR